MTKRICLLLAWVLLLWAGVAVAGDPAVDGEKVVPGKEVSTADGDVQVIVPPPPDSSLGIGNAGAAQDTGKTKKYVVQSGDSLWDLAGRFLGDPKRYFEIVEANREKYPSLSKNPGLILPGWEIDIPDGEDSPGSSGETYAQPVEGTVVVGSSLNIRTSPWGSIIGSLHDNDKVSIIGRQGDWYKIQHNGQTAYVHANYISAPGKPAGQTPVSQPSTPAPGGSDPGPVTAGSGRFGASPCSPMPGRASSEYGPRNLYGTFHHGIDLPVPTGTRLNAIGDGVVTGVGYEPGGGTFVKIRYDNGYESFMCHLQKYTVRTGQRVSMGQEIARSDNTGEYTTGAHLHLAMKKNGSYVNPRSVPGLPLP